MKSRIFIFAILLIIFILIIPQISSRQVIFNDIKLRIPKTWMETKDGNYLIYFSPQTDDYNNFLFGQSPSPFVGIQSYNIDEFYNHKNINNIYDLIQAENEEESQRCAQATKSGNVCLPNLPGPQQLNQTQKCFRSDFVEVDWYGMLEKENEEEIHECQKVVGENLIIITYKIRKSNFLDTYQASYIINSLQF